MYIVCFIPSYRCGNNNVVAVTVDLIVWQNTESINIILVLLYNCTYTQEWAYHTKGLSTDGFYYPNTMQN